MDRVTLSLIVFGAFAAVLLISKYFINKQQMKRVGKVFTVIELGGDKKKVARRIALIVALALVSFGALNLFFFDDINLVLTILQASALGILAYFMSQYNRLYLGELGFYGGGCKFKSINEVANADWDKDIGQLLWGLKIYINSKSEPFKIYIPREHKKEIENYFTENIM